MNKRFLWICIVLMALVLVVGCEDSPTDGSGGSGGGTTYADMSTNQKLVYEFFMTSVPLYTSLSETDSNSATFSYTLDAAYDTTMNTALGFTPQYIHNGTTVTGTLELLGMNFDQLYERNEAIPPSSDTTVSITYTATATGADIPGDQSVTIVYFTSGEYGADEPSTLTFTVDGASVTFTDLSFMDN